MSSDSNIDNNDTKKKHTHTHTVPSRHVTELWGLV